MELDQLKQIWEDPKNGENMSYTQSELLRLTKTKMSSLEHNIIQRDRYEIIACLILIISFGYIAFTAKSGWIQSGSLIMIVSGFFIWYKLKSIQNRLTGNGPSPDLPMSEYLKLELQLMIRQKSLLKNIMWWYILPIGSGLSLIIVGIDIGPVVKLVYAGIVMVLGIFVWALNQKAVKDTFDPLICEIKEAIRFVDKSAAIN